MNEYYKTALELFAETNGGLKRNGEMCFDAESLNRLLHETADNEREACAKVCDDRRRTVSNGNGLSMWSHDPATVEASYCADAIRKRANA